MSPLIPNACLARCNTGRLSQRVSRQCVMTILADIVSSDLELNLASIEFSVHVQYQLSTLLKIPALEVPVQLR